MINRISRFLVYSLILLSLSFCAYHESFSQSINTFNRWYNNPDPLDTNFSDSGWDIIENSHGYLCPCNSIGWSQAGPIIGQGYFMIQADFNGDSLWHNQYFRKGELTGIQQLISDP